MSREPEDRAGDLLTRLLTDPDFRSGFRRDPAAACLAFGLDDVAGELATGERGFQTLEVRESRSSLAGVLLAAAAEGVGVAELVDAASGSHGGDGRAAGAVSHALTHVKLRAVDPSQVSPTGAPGAGASADPLADGLAYDASDPPPTCPVCIARHGMPATYVSCPTCGDPAEEGEILCSHCATRLSSASGARSMAAVPDAPATPAASSAEARPRTAPVAEPSERPQAVAALAEVAPPAASTGGVSPIETQYLNGSNAGGAWHASEFMVRDAEGAPGPGGDYHAAYDLFAQAEAPIRAPYGGTVVEVRFNPATSGQVFGGTVKVQAPDGRVWVFRHVTPGEVTVGQTVQPGELIAKVSAWNGGATHTHVELWKSFPSSDGYRVDNMEDPLPELKALASGSGASVPAGGLAPGAVAPGGGAVTPVVAYAGGPAPVAAPVDVLTIPNLSIPSDAAQTLSSPDADPRMAAQISQLSAQHQIGISSVQVENGRTTVVIASVDGQPVSQGNVAARDLAQALAATPAQGRQVATPWPMKGDDFSAGEGSADRIELSFDPTPAPAADIAPVAPEDLGPGRGTAIFQGVGRPADAAAPGAATLSGQPAVAPSAPAVDPYGAAPTDPAAVPATGPAAQQLSTGPDAASAMSAIADPSGAGTLTPDQLRGAAAIIRVYEAHGLDPAAGISVALSESGLRPDAVGDAGTSFGLFQLHRGGALGSHSAEEAVNPDFNAGVAAQSLVKLGAAGKSTEEQVHIQVRQFERPADPDGRVVSDSANIPRARAIVALVKGQGGAPGLPAQGDRAAFAVASGGTPRAAGAVAAVEAVSGPAPAGPGRPDVVAYAKQFLGTKYVYGGADPSGFDCSGLVKYAYAHFGIRMDHYTHSQFGAFPKVEKSQLQPGDIVFFHNVEHEGMYIGNGQFIQAPHTGDVVKISNLDDGYYRDNYSGAVRPY